MPRLKGCLLAEQQQPIKVSIRGALQNSNALIVMPHCMATDVIPVSSSTCKHQLALSNQACCCPQLHTKSLLTKAAAQA